MNDDKQQKQRLLIVLVVSLTIFIFLIWLFNLQNRIKNIEDLKIVPQNQELSELRQDFDEAINQINQSINEVENKELTTEFKEEFKNEIKEEFLNDVIKEDSDGVATSSAEEYVVPVNNCPAYVNCMPTFGGSGNGPACYIPPACEGITQMVW